MSLLLTVLTELRSGLDGGASLRLLHLLASHGRVPVEIPRLSGVRGGYWRRHSNGGLLAFVGVSEHMEAETSTLCRLLPAAVDLSCGSVAGKLRLLIANNVSHRPGAWASGRTVTSSERDGERHGGHDFFQLGSVWVYVELVYVGVGGNGSILVQFQKLQFSFLKKSDSAKY